MIKPPTNYELAERCEKLVWEVLAWKAVFCASTIIAIITIIVGVCGYYVTKYSCYEAQGVQRTIQSGKPQKGTGGGAFNDTTVNDELAPGPGPQKSTCFR